MILVDSSVWIDYFNGKHTPQTDKVALRAARHYRTLRKMGITVRKTIDSLIATRCIEGNYRLLHCDEDFGPSEKHLGLLSVIPAA